MPEEQRLLRSGIPKRFWGMTLDTLDDVDGLDLVVSYADTLTAQREEGRGLLLVGNPGRGKTAAACAVLQQAIADGYDCVYTTMAAWRQRQLNNIDLKTAWQIHKDSDAYEEWRRNYDLFKRYRNSVDFLLLDDVGKEHSTQTRWIEDEFDFLLRHRFDKGLPTIITSNVKVVDWHDKYSDSMESFVQEAFFSVLMRSKQDLRRRYAAR